jgi:hypothetical protein
MEIPCMAEQDKEEENEVRWSQNFLDTDLVQNAKLHMSKSNMHVYSQAERIKQEKKAEMGTGHLL